MPQTELKKRIVVMRCIFFAIFLLLAGRLFYWQIIKAPELQRAASFQWKKDSELAAERGKIVDSQGLVLAQSGTAETVIAYPAQIASEQEAQRVATKLCELLSLDYNTVYARLTDTKASQVNIKRLVTADESREVRLSNLPGVDFAYETKRYYPAGSLASQLIGYTNIDGDGQEGIELVYNEKLRGVSGKIIAAKDGRGRALANGIEKDFPAADGCTVTLTINSVMQSFLEKALVEALEVNNAKSVQGLIMAPDTGEILAMATSPSFDLNSPPRTDGTKLRELSRNRVISDSYEPGSVFKIITLASALEEGLVDSDSEFVCNGYELVDGERIKCWRTTPHGHETLAEGVQNSCNPVFMKMALFLGKEKFYEYIDAFGFGQKTGVIELNDSYGGESAGIVRHQKYVRDVDLARIGFGQSISVTPLQLASAVSAAINGGNLMQPYLVSSVKSAGGEMILSNKPKVLRRVVSEETSRLTAQLLEGVVRSGSGKNAYIPGMSVGGKTGTAQKYEDGAIAQGKYVASFLGFAPADDPRLLCLILVDEPNISSQVFGSTVAAPYVRNVLSDALGYLGVQPDYDEGEKNYEISVTVPDVSGMATAEAVSALSECGLSVSADSETGNVLNQVPVAGSVVPKKTGVLLYTTEPAADEAVAELVEVPDLTGSKLKNAYYKLEQLGLTATCSGPPRSSVVSQFPIAGTKLSPGENVDLLLAYPAGSKDEAEYNQRQLEMQLAQTGVPVSAEGEAAAPESSGSEYIHNETAD